jgi:hypothetical protein
MPPAADKIKRLGHSMPKPLYLTRKFNTAGF